MEGQQRGRWKGSIKTAVVNATSIQSIQGYASQNLQAFQHLYEMREWKAQSTNPAFLRGTVVNSDAVKKTILYI